MAKPIFFNISPILFISSFVQLLVIVSSQHDSEVTLIRYYNTNNKIENQTFEALITSWPYVQNVSLSHLIFDSDLQQLEFDAKFANNGTIYVGGTDHLYKVDLLGQRLNQQYSVVSVSERDENLCRSNANEIKMLFAFNDRLIACGPKVCGRCYLYPSEDSLRQKRGIFRSLGRIGKIGTSGASSFDHYFSRGKSYGTYVHNEGHYSGLYFHDPPYYKEPNLANNFDQNAGKQEVPNEPAPNTGKNEVPLDWATNVEKNEVPLDWTPNVEKQQLPFKWAKNPEKMKLKDFPFSLVKSLIRYRSDTSHTLPLITDDMGYQFIIDMVYRYNYSENIIIGFTYKNCAYMLLRNSSKLETRLVRNCVHDLKNPDSTTHSEIPLKCQSYSLAQTASFSKQNHTEEGILYIVFNSENMNISKSSLCAFHMATIEEYFLNAIKRCCNKIDILMLFSNQYKKTKLCEMNTTVIDDKIRCERNSSADQYVFSGKVALGQEILALAKDKITSIGVQQLNLGINSSLSYIMMGTSNSRLIKMSLFTELTSSALSLKWSNVQHYTQYDSHQYGPFLPNPIFDKKTDTFYVLTKKSLQQIPMRSCSVFLSYDHCDYYRINHLDPKLHCYWYEKCLNIEEAKALKIFPEFDSFANITEIVYSTIKPTGWLIDLTGSNLKSNISYRLLLNNYLCIPLGPKESDNDQFILNDKQLRCRVETGNVNDEDLWAETMSLIVEVDKAFNNTLGKIMFLMPTDNNLNNRFKISIAIGVIFLFVIAVVIILRCSSKNDYSKVPKFKNLDEYFKAAYDNLDLFNTLKALGFILEDSTQINKIGDQIGSGYFGIVHRGKYNDIEVAMKTLKKLDDIKFKFQLQAFFMEADRMKEFNHKNVLPLTGVLILDEYPTILMPYMNCGDLHSYLQNEGNLISLFEIIEFSIQIADGMKYLSTNHFIHCDLAARNCLIKKSEGQLLIKIADFGLARRFLLNKYYYRTNLEERKLPYRWMPIEVLKGDNKMTSKIDVWSFGVLLWELFTRGHLPYGEIHGVQLDNYLKRGNRLAKPIHCPDIMYSIIMSCWYTLPCDRSTFAELLNKLFETSVLLHLNKMNESIFVDKTENLVNNFVPCPFNYNEANIKKLINSLYESCYKNAASENYDQIQNQTATTNF